jgi:hypothetical protein
MYADACRLASAVWRYDNVDCFYSQIYVLYCGTESILMIFIVITVTSEHKASKYLTASLFLCIAFNVLTVERWNLEVGGGTKRHYFLYGGNKHFRLW